MALEATPTKFGHGLLGATVADLTSAVAVGESWILSSLLVVNTTGQTRAVSIKIVDSGETSGDEHFIADELPIPPYGRYNLAVGDLLTTGDKLTGLADLADVIAFRISGSVVTTAA